MQNKYSRSRIVALLLSGLAVAGTTAFLLLSQQEIPPVDEEGIPVPFQFDASSDLGASIATIGRITQGSTVITIRQIGFDNNEITEVMQGSPRLDAMDFVLTPDSTTISHGAPLCEALTKQRLVYGYKYSTRAATAEKLARDQALAGAPKTFPELFPGQFLVSPEKRAAGTFISGLEAQRNIVFRDLCTVTLDKNARYLFIVEDVNTSFTARGLLWCGDGVTTAARNEQCDDGNRVINDACTNDCMNARCGDGIPQLTEQCDDGNAVNTDSCTNACTSARCGDGFQQGTEQCDDGNSANYDSCTNLCQNARCGDGFTQGNEQCDDGNSVNTDSCTNSCLNAACGDGFKQGTEQCDDGNAVNTDSCTNSCLNAACGDGFKQGTEQCDDGNTVNTDSCTNVCTNAVCGDGFRQGTEQCDDGNAVNTDTCTNTCTSARCGDGFVQGMEQCDDANTVNTDACSTSCMSAVCRDGIHQPLGADNLPGTTDDEQCDDGNNIDDDACDNLCRLISPF